MSRCYPYLMKHKTSSEVPPPRYERKANVELGLSPKKEKHKREDKKKKRRKESESNGDVPRDLDNRSKKAQQTGDVSLANGSLPGAKATSSETVHEKVAQRLQADTSHAEMPSAGIHEKVAQRLQAYPSHAEMPSAGVREKVAQRLQAYPSHAEMPSAGVLAISCKGLPTIAKQGSQLSLVSVKAACSSNGAAVNEAAPSSSASSKPEVILGRESDTQYIPHVEKVWSILDDQEWLFHHNKLLQSVPMIKDENSYPLVWAEAVFLPSVGIHALPYVVPD